ncbi:MAG: LLM class flavin-dependent oxidoreductase [Ktedonobacterales bacterium]
MRYGLELPNAGIGGDPRVLADLAQLAEVAGWDGVFLEDYITHSSAYDAATYDPWVALAAMALHTRRIRLGTTVTPLSRRRPWKLARETVTLDHLSQGRLILGVGLGDTQDPGFSAVGEITDARQRARMLDETLDILVGLWSGKPFSYVGVYFQLQEVVFLPQPIQTPRIPIWVGGNWPHRGPIKRAAQWDGFVGGKAHADDEDWHVTPQETHALIEAIRRQRSVETPFDVALGGGPRGDDLEEERAMIRSLADAGATWWMEYVTPELGGLDAMRARIKAGPVRIE